MAIAKSIKAPGRWKIIVSQEPTVSASDYGHYDHGSDYDGNVDMVTWPGTSILC